MAASLSASLAASLAPGQLTQLLLSCADMVLRCSDGRAIPCVRFHCLATCEAIRNLAEDAVLEKDERGRLVVPFPNVDSSDLAIAMDVVHGVLAVGELCAATAPAALRGLRALGNDALDEELVERLWEVTAAGSMLDVQPHLDDLLHTRSVRLAVLRRVAVLCPTWPDFRRRVLGGLAMDVDTATWLLRHLPQFYPAGLAFVAVLDALPPRVLDPATALRLLSAPCSAPHFHPAEALDAVHALARLFAREGWDAGQLDFMRSLLTAMRAFDVAPHVASDVHGSIVTITGAPAVSVLLTVRERRGGVCSRKMAPWLRLHVDWATGAVDARLSLRELASGVRGGWRALGCEVRLTAYEHWDDGDDGDGGDRMDGEGGLVVARAPATSELWYACQTTHPAGLLSLSEHGRYAAGDADAFRAAVRSSALSRLRVDVFYARHSVLHKAFF